MAKLRLTQNMRDALNARASGWVACPAEQKVHNAAYKKAAPLVRRAVEKKYPPADMAICKKYDAAKADTCIRLQCSDGVVREFKFDSEDAAPLAVCTNYCRSRIYLADPATTDAVTAWITASDALAAALKAKLSDYHALISAAGYLDEIEAVWPLATEIRARFTQNLPAQLTDDVVARIRADVGSRAKAA